MNLYQIARPLFFALDSEHVHEMTLNTMRLVGTLRIPHSSRQANAEAIEVMGLRFPNRVGLAAGLDKNGIAVDGLAGLGFGFLEVGTVTPRPQAGNPKPRLFRLVAHEAIINRMGFNNSGVDALLKNLASIRYSGVLGINIGKNATTPMEQAIDDYIACLDKVYSRASYITINISSPNTKGLRQLQGESELDALLLKLKNRQTELTQQQGHYVPLALKIAPDLDIQHIGQISDALRKHQIDGVIATNTTLGREGVEESEHAQEAGGLSGAPLSTKSTEIVRLLARALAGEIPIIAAGGIMCAEDAKAKIAAGASLIQLYSGLIYRGPGLVRECAHALSTPSQTSPRS